MGWHAFTYLCILLQHFSVVPQTNMGNGEFHDVGMELKCDGALDIHDDVNVITYFQASEVHMGLTFKKHDQNVHKAKWFKWELGNTFLWVWIDEQM